MMNEIKNLNELFGGAGVEFKYGPNNLIVATLNNQYGSVEVSLHGAHVLSYTPCGEKPVIWMSTKSYFEENKPIRGGIPVCAPWFGPNPDKNLPSHGYVRLCEWRLTGSGELPDGGSYITLELSAEAAKHCFEKSTFDFVMQIELSEHLKVSLKTTNVGSSDAGFTGALHTYFNVSQIGNIAVHGLNDVKYWDSLKAEYAVQIGDITFDREVDRIYENTSADCTIIDRGFDRNIVVAKHGSKSTVVWNPWIDKSIRMVDFGDEEYKNMVCVETANARDDKRIIAPGQSHELGLEIYLD